MTDATYGAGGDTYRRWRESVLVLEEADNVALARLREAFLPGRWVSYKHGFTKCLVEVVDVVGYTHQGARLKVRRAAGSKPYFIYPYRVIP